MMSTRYWVTAIMVNFVTELLLEMAYTKPKHDRETDTTYPSNPVDRKGGYDYEQYPMETDNEQ